MDTSVISRSRALTEISFGNLPEIIVLVAHTVTIIERCALAGDQVGQGHAVGCEVGKLCKLVDTVKRGVQAPAGRNTETYDAAMASLAR